MLRVYCFSSRKDKQVISEIASKIIHAKKAKSPFFHFTVQKTTWMPRKSKYCLKYQRMCVDFISIDHIKAFPKMWQAYSLHIMMLFSFQNLIL